MAQPDCPLCGGTGFRLVERVDANEQAERVVRRQDAGNGAAAGTPKLTWAVPCDCTGGNRATRTIARARIPRRYEHCDFENFAADVWESRTEANAWNRSLTKAKLVVEAFARDYPANGETGLLLMGPCGVGKTHLAVAALRQLLTHGHGARFYDYRELLKELQASYNPDHPISEMSVLEPMLETEVLLIDDIGASKPSAWVLDTIGHILNKRYNERRVTVLTTNYLDAPEPRSRAAGQDRAGSGEMSRLPSGVAVAAAREDTLSDRLGQRVRSRLYEMCRTVEISSADFRMEIRKARSS